jgi:Xaa-Pro dipeptidase
MLFRYLDGTPERRTRPGIKKLRTARTVEAGMVLTNEPGCYFISTLIQRALDNESQSKYINYEVLERFFNFGGVRLEDVICVTEDGVINLTTCPRTITEIESVMAGGKWPPQVDEAPYLRRQWGKLSERGTAMVDITLM